MYKCIPTPEDQQELAKPIAELHDAFTRMVQTMESGHYGKDTDRTSDMQHTMARMLQKWFKLEGLLLQLFFPMSVSVWGLCAKNMRRCAS